MSLSPLLLRDRINLDLKAKTKEDVVNDLVLMVKKGADAELLASTLLKREELGSTGIGRGIAIPHCRSLIVDKLEIAVGRSSKGINFTSIDKKPVHIIFLIVAPPQDPENQYLLTLARIVQIGKELSKKDLIMRPQSPEEFIKLIGEIEKNIARDK